MTAYFAELKNNIVQQVVAADDISWCQENLGGEWVQTYYSTQGKNYAGIGDTYHPDVDNFSGQQPFPSWVLDSNYKWQPPVPYPSDGDYSQGIYYEWDELNTQWVRV